MPASVVDHTAFHLDQVTVNADNFRVEELPAHYSGDVV